MQVIFAADPTAPPTPLRLRQDLTSRWSRSSSGALGAGLWRGGLRIDDADECGVDFRGIERHLGVLSSRYLEH